MSEREHSPIWKDPADPTEKRDWDVPSAVHDEPAALDLEDTAEAGDSARREESALSRESRRRAPPDESEKRDWDVP
jgi:hypothetical protein